MRTDQVVVEGSPLPDGAVMHVFERAVTLADGTTLWLRRWWEPDRPGRRVMLDGHRWCVKRGGTQLYARPTGLVRGEHGAEWAYLTPHGFDSWEDALVAGERAEAAERAAHSGTRRTGRRTGGTS